MVMTLPLQFWAKLSIHLLTRLIREGESGSREAGARLAGIRWVEVSHQYDTLGRLCAMLVPYGMGSATAAAKTVGQ